MFRLAPAFSFFFIREYYYPPSVGNRINPLSGFIPDSIGEYKQNADSCPPILKVFPIIEYRFKKCVRFPFRNSSGGRDQYVSCVMCVKLLRSTGRLVQNDRSTNTLIDCYF